MSKIIEGKITWKQMDGDNDLEKKINHYLTKMFILSSGVPSDECITEAKYIISLCVEELSKPIKKVTKTKVKRPQ